MDDERKTFRLAKKYDEFGREIVETLDESEDSFDNNKFVMKVMKEASEKNRVEKDQFADLKGGFNHIMKSFRNGKKEEGEEKQEGEDGNLAVSMDSCYPLG